MPPGLPGGPGRALLPGMNPWLLLACAIALEVTGTTALKLSEGMARLPWVAVVLVGYGGAFAALARVLQSLPVGITYAVWSGLGTVGAAVVGRAVSARARAAARRWRTNTAATLMRCRRGC